MLGQRMSVGLDLHARSVVACGIDGQSGEVWDLPGPPLQVPITGQRGSWESSAPRRSSPPR